MKRDNESMEELWKKFSETYFKRLTTETPSFGELITN